MGAREEGGVIREVSKVTKEENKSNNTIHEPNRAIVT